MFSNLKRDFMCCVGVRPHDLRRSHRASSSEANVSLECVFDHLDFPLPYALSPERQSICRDMTRVVSGYPEFPPDRPSLLELDHDAVRQAAGLPSSFSSQQHSRRTTVTKSSNVTTSTRSTRSAGRQSFAVVCPSAKIVTFIRHGESVGNAGLMGAIEAGSVWGYRDGELTSRGEDQAASRVAMMDEATIFRVTSAETVLVSPLKRAMATAVVVLAEAHYKRFGKPPVQWPTVEVVAELREMVRSDSERPGTGHRDALEYVRSIASTYAQRRFGSSSALDQVVSSLALSYMSERERTCDWQPDPEDAHDYIATIATFKESLAMRTENTVLLVGHSGWARFAFSAFLPQPPVPAGPQTESSGEPFARNILIGSRQILPLNNCGVVQARFRDGRFENVIIDAVAPGDEAFPNCATSAKLGVFVSVREAKVAGVVPTKASLTRLFLSTAGHPKGRLFCLSSFNGKSHLSWSDDWGELRDSLLVNDGQTSFQQKRKRRTFLVHDATGERPPMTLKAHNDKDFDKLSRLLSQYQQIDTEAHQSLDASLVPR